MPNMYRTIRTPPVLFALVSLAGLTACEPEVGGPLGVSPAAIVDDPGAYYGSRITASGQVDDVYSPGTFTIGGPAFDGELLIQSVDSIGAVAERSFEQPVRRGDVVQVTGIVRRFADLEPEDHYGYDPTDLEDQFDGQPVIVSRSSGARLEHVVVMPRRSGAGALRDDRLLTDVGGADGADGRDLEGRGVHFREATSVDVVGDDSFWAAVNSDTLFVVLMPGSTDGGPLGEPDSMRVWELYGVLRDVPTSRQLSADWELTEETIARLSQHTYFLHAVHAIRADEADAAIR